MTRTVRIFVAIAACLGAAGVVLAAAGAHGGGDARLLANASTMCLAHAPVLLALAALSDRLAWRFWPGALIAAGTILFAADLVVRYLAGATPVPMAAPVGGMAMIAGWLLLAVSAVISRPR